MRFVAVKSVEQQALLIVHRVRKRLSGEHAALINQLRGLLAEFGIVIPKGHYSLHIFYSIPWCRRDSRQISEVSAKPEARKNARRESVGYKGNPALLHTSEAATTWLAPRSLCPQLRL